MNTEKAIDKIRKLLALAQSDNPGEAENALLLARKLMAEHKLTERDVSDAKKPGKLAQRFYTSHTFSPLRNGWMINLAHVIAENHCCCVSAYNNRGSTVHNIVFTGLGDDPDIAMTLFDYAIQHIFHASTNYRNESLFWITDRKYKNQQVRSFEMSYALGFAQGLEAKYREQFKDEQGQSSETALVMVKPKEVEDFQKCLRSKSLNFRQEQRNSEARSQGYRAGYNFDPTKQIREATV